jgi:hypothetical protein
MMRDPVVSMNAEIEAARLVHYAADDAHHWTEARRLALQLTNLERAEGDIAPTSNACAEQKLFNVAALHRLDLGLEGETTARSATRLAGKVGRGEITPLTVRQIRALMPACQIHDVETCNDGATVKALTHAINWCARLRLV